MKSDFFSGFPFYHWLGQWQYFDGVTHERKNIKFHQDEEQVIYKGLLVHGFLVSGKPIYF